MKRNLSVELRPQTLDEFIGCESVIAPIREGLRQGRVDSTYSFFGPPGCGKTSMARAVFSEISGKQEDYDLTEPDTSELDADHLRALISKARLNPWIGQYKGIILDEAHKIRADVQLILLKALEEPCDSTVWFICSSDPGKLDPAIRRRGARYVMPALNLEQTHQLLEVSLAKVIQSSKDSSTFKSLHEQLQALALALSTNEVTSPGLIIRALELFITGVPVKEAAQVSEVTSVDTFAIAKGAAAGNWAAIAPLLAAAPLSAARDIRSKVAGYFRSILLKSPTSSPRVARCVWAIQQMAELANQNQYEDGLIMSATCASLYNICVGQKEFISKKG